MSKEDMCIIEGKDWSYEVYNYRKFREVMNHIKKSIELMDSVIGIIDIDFFDKTTNWIIDDLIDLLNNMYKDKNTIPWFIFETDFGTKGDCRIYIGEGIKQECFCINNLFHLYNYLIDNLKIPETKETISMKGIFEEFLKEENCYYEFHGNFDYISCDVSFDNEPPEEWIYGAFIWTETPEGHQFWRKINDKWEDRLEGLRYYE